MRTTRRTESGLEMSRSDTAHLSFVRPDAAPAQPVVQHGSPPAAPPAQSSANGLSPERELLDLLPDAYLATDCSGGILDANTAASELFSLSRHELRGLSLLDFVAAEDIGRVTAVMSGEASPARGALLEVRLKPVGGDSVVAELRVSPQGRRRVVHWFVRDITRQRLTEQALREEADNYRRLANRLPVLAYSLGSVNPAGEPTFVSPRMAELFGLPVEEWSAVPQLWLRQVHPDDRARVLNERAQACEKVTGMRCEYRVVAADRQVRRVRDEVHVTNSERALGLEGVIFDVTGRGGSPDAEARVGSRRGVVPASEEGNRRTFLRLFLHDVRSPLAVAVAIVETLLRDEEGLEVEQRRDLLTRVVQNLEHIHHLLSEVVDIERLEQRQVAVRLEATDVKTVVERLVRAMGESDHPVEFRGSVCIAHTDASLVERAVSKLLDNAFTHTPPATGVWVGVEEVDHGVVVSVEDEGPGVPDEVKERIFQAFDRGRAPTTTAGFGLGLALVRHIVQVLGGQIWVEDRPGGGASFRLFLPSRPA